MTVWQSGSVAECLSYVQKPCGSGPRARSPGLPSVLSVQLAPAPPMHGCPVRKLVGLPRAYPQQDEAEEHGDSNEYPAIPNSLSVAAVSSVEYCELAA